MFKKIDYIKTTKIKKRQMAYINCRIYLLRILNRKKLQVELYIKILVTLIVADIFQIKKYHQFDSFVLHDKFFNILCCDSSLMPLYL